jgi:hypothetical protein
MKVQKHMVILIGALALSLLGGAVWADEPASQNMVQVAAGDVVASQAAGASAEVKAAKNIVDREPVEEGTSFTAGEKVWIWSRVHNAKDTTITHVWKFNGDEIWTATLDVKSSRWTTYSRRTVRAGQYEVVVQGQDGAVLGSVSFSVQ